MKNILMKKTNQAINEYSAEDIREVISHVANLFDKQSSATLLLKCFGKTFMKLN